MCNVSDKSCTEILNTDFVFNNVFVEDHDVYEIMWNLLQSREGLMATRRIVIIIIIIIINCNLVVTRWQWLFYIHTKYEIGY